MSDALVVQVNSIRVLRDGTIQDGHTRIKAWPVLRMKPVRTLQLTHEIIWAQPGDKLWEFTKRIPPSLLALVRTAPTNPWELLELAAAAPERGCELLRQCPALALLVARSCPIDCENRAEFYCRLLDRTWRQMLAAVGLPPRRRYVRLLRKLPLAHCHEAALESLTEAIQQRHPHLRVLAHLPRITRDTVALLTLPPKLVSPHLLLASAESPADSTPVMWRVEAVSWFLEMETPGCPWPFGKLRADELAKVEGRMRARLAGDFNQLAPFPPPPLPGMPNWITPLQNYWAVLAEGHEQGNCASLFIEEIFSGDGYLYAITGAERATLLLRRIGESSLWIIADLRAEGNRAVKPETRRRAEQWVRDSQTPHY